MTHEQILINAIAKAQSAGWVNEEQFRPIDVGVVMLSHAYKPEFMESIETLIFNHDFAKALWGDKEIVEGGSLKIYEFHLQQMVIAENPIAYLGKNL